MAGDDRELSGEGTPFHDGMQCFVRSIGYDFQTKVGIVWMDARSCTDMSGAISVFKQIDPGVQEIRTYAERKPDTVYVRDGDQWQARRGR